VKIPVQPPDIQQILSSILEQDSELAMQLLRGELGPPTDNKGRYLHWDKLRHLTPPEGFSSEQWWVSIKQSRRSLKQSTPFLNKYGELFWYCVPPALQKELHWLDLHAAGTIQANDAITNPHSRSTYLVRSLIEEAINSSQLEGASTTRHVAKEMIRQGRSPSNKSEQMIINNYHAMQFIREIKDDALTSSMVFELHRVLTENTLDNPAMAGNLRSDNDDITVIDNRDQQILHTPPDASELESRMVALCEFANTPDESGFLHPVIRAILLHFMLAYDHPFVDGNGRTARALFYWSMAHQGYWLMEYISISAIIKKAPAKYSRAYLHTETDNDDLTYFIIHQVEVIHQAIADLHTYLDQKMRGIGEAEQLLKDNPRLKKMNFRQLALLRHALKHPRFAYVVHEHQASHGIAYDTARRDLISMADKFNLLTKTKQGKNYLFIAPQDLEKRIKQQ
jgi:Fic family protein